MFRAVHPDAWVTPTLSLLRDLEHTARMLWWAKTEDAKLGRNRPKRVLFTEAERRAELGGADRYDALPIEEITRLLGWDKPQS